MSESTFNIGPTQFRGENDHWNPSLIRFFRAPVNPEPNSVLEDDDEGEQIEVLYVEIPTDEFSKPVLQVEDANGRPRRQALRAWGIEKEYDAYRMGITAQKIRTPIQEAPIRQALRDELLVKGYVDVESVMEAPESAMCAIFGDFTGRKVYNELAEYAITRQKDEQRDSMAKDLREGAKKLSDKDRQLKEMEERHRKELRDMSRRLVEAEARNEAAQIEGRERLASANRSRSTDTPARRTSGGRAKDPEPTPVSE